MAARLSSPRRTTVCAELALSGSPRELEITVYYSYFPRDRGNREVAPAPATAEIDRVFVCNGRGQPVCNLTPLLDAEWLDVIEGLVLEQEHDE